LIASKAAIDIKTAKIKEAITKALVEIDASVKKETAEVV
jgi:hypothetical protein